MLHQDGRRGRNQHICFGQCSNDNGNYNYYHYDQKSYNSAHTHTLSLCGDILIIPILLMHTILGLLLLDTRNLCLHDASNLHLFVLKAFVLMSKINMENNQNERNNVYYGYKLEWISC